MSKVTTHTEAETTTVKTTTITGETTTVTAKTGPIKLTRPTRIGRMNNKSNNRNTIDSNMEYTV